MLFYDKLEFYSPGKDTIDFYVPFSSPLPSRPAGRQYDTGQHHASNHQLCPAAHGRQPLSAAVQHGGHLGRRQLRLQRGILRRRHGRPDRQHADRLFHRPRQRRWRRHQPVLRRGARGQGARNRPHLHRHDARAVRGVHRCGRRADARDAAHHENPRRGHARVDGLSDGVFRGRVGSAAV